MDADLLPELSGETWVASALLDELTVDLPAAGVGDELVSDTANDKILQTVRSWVESGVAPPWLECAGLAPELRSWRLQVGNIKIDSGGRLWRRRSPPAVGSQLVVPVKKRQEFIREFHDSLFAGHLGITRTVYRLLDRVYWPGLRGDVQTYIKSCTICIARKSPCPRKVPMGHVNVGDRWERTYWLWTYWTCRSPQHGAIDMSSLWWTASPGGQRRFLYRTKRRNRWRMRSSIRLFVGLGCRV